MSITSTPKLRELALGAKLLRSQPQFIDHAELIPPSLSTSNPHTSQEN